MFKEIIFVAIFFSAACFSVAQKPSLVPYPPQFTAVISERSMKIESLYIR